MKYTINYLLSVICLVLILGCQSNVEENKSLKAEEIIVNSQKAMKHINNFKFSLSHKKGSIDLGNNLKLVNAYGEITKNGMQIDTESSFGRALVKTSAIIIKQQTWMTNPLTQTWSEISQNESPFNFINPSELINEILYSLYDLEIKDHNQNFYTVTGKTSSQSFKSLVGIVENNLEVVLDLEINKEFFTIQKVFIYGQVQPKDQNDNLRIIEFSNYHQIEPLVPPSIND